MDAWVAQERIRLLQFFEFLHKIPVRDVWHPRDCPSAEADRMVEARQDLLDEERIAFRPKRNIARCLPVDDVREIRCVGVDGLALLGWRIIRTRYNRTPFHVIFFIHLLHIRKCHYATPVSLIEIQPPLLDHKRPMHGSSINCQNIFSHDSNKKQLHGSQEKYSNYDRRLAHRK